MEEAVMGSKLLTLASPFIQYGFAGFCVILLAILVWMASRFLKVLLENNKVIERNTSALQSLDERTKNELELIRDLHDETRGLRERLLSRPCQVGEMN